MARKAPRPAPGWGYERGAWERGSRLVAGVDEAGRGCLFGPVFAAAVILDPQASPDGLDDSKRLTPAIRRRLDELIRSTALSWSVRAVDAARIDLLNILQASRLAMRLAVEALEPRPDFLLVDAVTVETPTPQLAIVKGDARSVSIAAASILAKVARDRCMREWDAVYPQYALRSNKGYATSVHLEALRAHGCTPQHRLSFSPVRRLAAHYAWAPTERSRPGGLGLDWDP